MLPDRNGATSRRQALLNQLMQLQTGGGDFNRMGLGDHPHPAPDRSREFNSMGLGDSPALKMHEMGLNTPAAELWAHRHPWAMEHDKYIPAWVKPNLPDHGGFPGEGGATPFDISHGFHLPPRDGGPIGGAIPFDISHGFRLPQPQQPPTPPGFPFQFGGIGRPMPPFPFPTGGGIGRPMPPFPRPIGGGIGSPLPSPAFGGIGGPPRPMPMVQ